MEQREVEPQAGAVRIPYDLVRCDDALVAAGQAETAVRAAEHLRDRAVRVGLAYGLSPEGVAAASGVPVAVVAAIDTSARPAAPDLAGPRRPTADAVGALVWSGTGGVPSGEVVAHQPRPAPRSGRLLLRRIGLASLGLVLVVALALSLFLNARSQARYDASAVALAYVTAELTGSTRAACSFSGLDETAVTTCVRTRNSDQTGQARQLTLLDAPPTVAGAAAYDGGFAVVVAWSGASWDMWMPVNEPGAGWTVSTEPGPAQESVAVAVRRGPDGRWVVDRAAPRSAQGTPTDLLDRTVSGYLPAF